VIEPEIQRQRGLAPESNPATPQQSAAARPIHLLLASDRPDDAHLFREYLGASASSTFEITVVERLEQIRNHRASDDIDIIVFDLSLPDGQGVQMLDELVHGKNPVPVIVLSEFDDEELALQAVRHGAQDYLVKDQISQSTLPQSIRYAIERFRVLETLREREERYALAAQATNDGLWDWDLRSDSVYYSPRWCTMIGIGDAEITSSPAEWFNRIHPDDLSSVQAAIQNYLHGRSRHFEIEYRMRHRNGNYRWMLSRGAALFDQNNVPYRLAGSQTDVTTRKHTEQRLIHETLHDPLTTLPNRLFLQRRLQHTLQQLNSGLLPRFAVLLIDLDRFKTINDSLGHVAGDQLLCSIARRLENCLSPGTTITRLGGDEFAILLDSISIPADALRIVKRILEAMSHPFHIQQHRVFTSGCIGIVLSSDQYTNPDEILRDADTAMFRAKSEGPGRCQIFDAAMHTRAVALWRLETDLRRAVERQEFSTHYQPIVSLASGRLAGFEALVRWNHPERGLLYPEAFLSLADETGLLATIDRWMIFNGAQQLKKWQQQYPNNASLFLNLNLSDGLINQNDLPGFMQEVLRETGIDPRTLKLEITETVISSDLNSMRNTLARLRDMNLQLCLDDFGTGYSSLDSLHTYSVDVLKIASSFVAAMTSKGGGPEIVRTIITLAHDLDLQVIAEGIETSEQYAQLQAMGCEYGQGRLFSQAEGLDEEPIYFDLERNTATGGIFITQS